jgi:hypothetical protein
MKILNRITYNKIENNIWWIPMGKLGDIYANTYDGKTLSATNNMSKEILNIILPLRNNIIRLCWYECFKI